VKFRISLTIDLVGRHYVLRPQGIDGPILIDAADAVEAATLIEERIANLRDWFPIEHAPQITGVRIWPVEEEQ
jgi:hypothetical protein